MIEFDTLNLLLGQLFTRVPIRVTAYHSTDDRIKREVEGMRSETIRNQIHELDGKPEDYFYIIKIGMG